MGNFIRHFTMHVITYPWWDLSQSMLVKGVFTHWGRVMHICVGVLTDIDSDNGLLPERRQAIIWTNVGILLIGPLGTNFSEFLIGIHAFSFKKMHLRMSSAKWRPFCLGLNVLISDSTHHQSYQVWSHPAGLSELTLHHLCQHQGNTSIRTFFHQDVSLTHWPLGNLN